MKHIQISFKRTESDGQFRIAAITYPDGGQNTEENDLVTIMNILRIREKPVVRTEENNEFAYTFAADF
ncbi:MAG: hypothetical protein IKB31_02955 [Bacteroidaceae bacterium]|nr:hypothetical protein [Bacteroidaceae bacterium]